ncbi:MAG: translocation/assembly module TamB domain-containing protein [Bacteroides sp.]|nr:translocation/assembly module TamB domain-containing protein [Bacteroides sp.]
MSVAVGNVLSKTLNSRLTIGSIDMGLLNRIIINDLRLEDRKGEEMLKVTRLAAKFDILPLFKGRMSLNNIQLFGFNARLEKETPEAEANFQFVLDAFASKDTVKKETALDLRINSILIRRGKVSYDIRSEAETPGRFNPAHIHLGNIAANISLKALQNDSINAAIRRLNVEEENSGFNLKKLSLKVIGNDRQMRIENFAIELPRTTLKMDTIRMQYDSLAAFSHFARDVRFTLSLLPSQIVLRDLSPLVPALSSFSDPIEVEAKAEGNTEQFSCPLLSVSSGEKILMRGDLQVKNLARPQDLHLHGDFSRLHIAPEGFEFLVRNLSKQYEGVPPILQRIGTLDFHGEVKGRPTDMTMYGHLITDLGNIQTDMKLTSNRENGLWTYAGNVATTDFELGSLLDNDKLEKVTLALSVDGRHQTEKPLAMHLKGLVASIDYSGYNYRNITLDGLYEKGGFDGQIALNDPNGKIDLNGHINTAERIPTFDFLAEFSRVRPHNLHLTDRPEYEDAELSVKLKANFTGGSIDEMNGDINIDSLLFESPQQRYFMENMHIAAIHPKEQAQKLSINSPFLKANIEGDYSYKTLPTSLLNILRHYLPALIPAEQRIVKSENNFHFDLDLYETDFFSTVLLMPVKVYTHSTLKGYVNDRAQRLRIEGYFPRLRYGDKFIESGMVLCENPGDRFHTHLRFNERKKNGAVNVALEAYAQNDTVRTNLNWGNSSEVTYSGQLSVVAGFLRRQLTDADTSHPSGPAPLKTVIDIEPTRVILNDTLWQIHPSQVVLADGKIEVNNFNFSNKARHLRVDGTISKSPQDTVHLDLKDINIAYVFDIADLGVSFRGEATGPAYACGVLEKPFMSTDLSIRNFGPFEGVLGDAKIHGEWHHDVKGIRISADIQEKELSRTLVDGYIYPIKPTSSLDLQIKAGNTNLEFIHYFMQSITPEFKGRVTGDVHLYGKFKGLNMQGKVLGDASLKVEVLNTTFTLKDSILIEPQGLTFRNNRIFDTQGNQGRMSGYLRYRHFKNLSYNFDFTTDNMLLMNTKETPDFPFYGTIYGTGNVSLTGGAGSGLNADVAVTTNRNSTFTYIKDYVSTAANNQFIKFVDKTPRRAVQDSIILSDYELARKEVEQETESDADIRLNLLVDATPDATMKIIMDPAAGDYISGKGSGNIRAEFYNKGDVKMFGNYRLNQGVYKFSLQEVIRKDFNIRDGSTISFSGQPGDATLDIHASYTVNSASLNDLMPNAADYVSQTNVKVNCIMDLKGQLTSPTITLGLELPNERDEVQALVRNYIPTDEQMHMQILYLLGIGKFYTPENVETSQNSNMMSSVLSSTLSGQLNNALSNIINNNNWNIGTNFSTGEKGWTDMEFEGILSGQLLNNRLLINGNFGYRENPLANTNFVGDFEAEWLVTRSGDIRLKAYNETNDRYYTRTNLTTQGIGIIFKKDFDKWNELLFWKKWKLKMLQKRKKAAQE